MTFQPNKTIKELNIDTTRKFVMVDDEYHSFKKGDILELERDDGSYHPLFKRISDGKIECCFIDRLDYYNPIKTWDTLEIGDEVKDRDGNSRWVLGVCGRVIFLTTYNEDSYGSGSTKEELVKKGYTIVQPEPQEDHEVEKAIKLLEDKGIIKEGKIIN